MARSLPGIPDNDNGQITQQDGRITVFFRLLWQILIDGWAKVPTAGNLDKTGLTAGISATTILTPLTAGFVRISYSLLKTVADGTSSSLTLKVSWTQGGSSLSHSFAAFTTDSAGAHQEDALPIYVDAGTAVTVTVTYASNTANKMTYDCHVAAEQVVN